MFQFTVTKVTSILESEGLVTVTQRNPTDLKIGMTLIYYTLQISLHWEFVNIHPLISATA